jgi:hypothetical protein
MTDTFDFTALETTESEPEENSMPDTTICNVPGCHNPTVEYSGRGPRPKKCKDHKGKSGATTTRKKKTYGTDYTEGITELLQIPAAVLGVVGMQANNIPLVADAEVINQYAPHIGSAVNGLAQERPEVAAALDRILKAGPYAALIGAVVPMVTQILANHKILPAGVMGTKTAEQVLGIPTQVPVSEDAR